jgi:26S proteasome regulatory subunit T1
VKKVDELKVCACSLCRAASLRSSRRLQGIKDSDTGLSNPGQWDLDGDAQLRTQHPLQVARCTKIIQPNPNVKNDKTKCVLPPCAPLLSHPLPPRYVINIRSYAKFVVALHDEVASTDVEEGMRVGVDRQSYKIMLPLPAKIDPTVTMMQARLPRRFKRV